MSHSRRIVFFFIALIILGSYLWISSQNKPIIVSVVPVQSGKIEQVATNTRAGTVTSCRRARLAPAIGGQISSLNVKKGDQVKSGQLLLEIWNEDLKANVLLAEEEVIATRSRSREACVTAEVAKKEAQRLKTLRKKNLSSDEDTDRAIGTAAAKQAACNAGRANIMVSKAHVKLVTAQLQRTLLHAPFSGIIAELHGEVGEFATPSPIGVPTLPNIDLLDQNCIYVSAPIDEVDAPQLHQGMTARISLDAFSKTSYPGKIKRIAAYVLDLEKQARTVEVEVDFAPNTNTQQLLPGYSADVEIIIREKQNVLRIPTEAIQDGNHVLVLNADTSLLEQRTIKTGISNWQYTEILEGLSLNEQVVTSTGRKGVEADVLATAE